MNAFCHRDYRASGPVLVKISPTTMEISNNGGFIGGITAENILHHLPAPRNPSLVGALIKLNLVNRSNLGISRTFEAFLMEGKEPPLILDIGDAVGVTFARQDISPLMRSFVAERLSTGRYYSVDELLILNYLVHHPEIDTGAASSLCQQREPIIRGILTTLETEGLIERGGTGRGTYWSIAPAIHRRLSESGDSERNRRIDREAAKTRILSILIERAHRGERGLSNSEIRKITHYDRHQVYHLMKELKAEESRIIGPGKGHTALYEYYEEKR
jgi:ATP-dependent DNA helicase RecG